MPQPGYTRDAPPSIADALGALGALERLLADERSAVASLDAGRLAALADEKRGLAERLNGILADLGPGAASSPQARASDPARSTELRQATQRVVAQAEANVALLGDAIALLAGVLGMRREAGTYDARARLIAEVRAVARRNI